jgi:hypothetical protein
MDEQTTPAPEPAPVPLPNNTGKDEGNAAPVAPAEPYRVGYGKPPVETRFKKGDKRINRGGRPRDFDMLRKLAQQIAGEALPSREGEQAMTRVTALLRVMSSSKAPADRRTFLEYAYGKPKDEVDVTSGGEVIEFVVRTAKAKDETHTD